MGVREKLARRGRSGARISGWDMLWLLLSFVAYTAGAMILPRFREPWGNALVWACYGLGWVVLVAVTDHLLRRRRKPAWAPVPRERRHGWRFALYLCVLLSAMQLQEHGSGRYQWAIILVAGTIIVLAERTVEQVVSRREAARRKREAADLARQF